ncbi:enoyl-CoA hydratase/isomerase family protein [Halobacillus seohaensis]|uniref:Enoyl-CoA hydratase/isomerase family protein n=1 Tax=Halobacillus seohaensis TaxID=447421 RepID=A0ABW2EII1_9BACI
MNGQKEPELVSGSFFTSILKGMDFQMEQIKATITDQGLAIITLNRSEKMNAVTKKMTDELKQILSEFKLNSNMKCLLITGSGDQAFCAGGDLREHHADMSESEAYQILHPMKEVLYEIATFPMPTFAYLNGPARGGGCELATACDFRYGLKDVEFGFVQGDLGITPGWGGGELLYKRIRPELAAHWLIDSKMYTTIEAYQIGWLHKIVSLEELKNNPMIDPFLKKSYEQLRTFKEQYLQKLSIDQLSAEMDEEVRNCANLWESKEHIEAVDKFMSRRKSPKV